MAAPDTSPTTGPQPTVSDVALAVDSFYTSLRTLAHVGDKLLQAPAQGADVALKSIQDEVPQVFSSLPKPVRTILVNALLTPIQAIDGADHVVERVLETADEFIRTGKLPNDTASIPTT